MQPVLRVLDDICYVLECAATHCMGEGKSELSALCGRLEGSDEAYAVPEREHLAARLRVIHGLYRSDQRQDASVRLGRISRELWATVDVARYSQASQKTSGEAP
jgi:hypothetical protein